MTVGEKIVHLRIVNNISQEELSNYDIYANVIDEYKDAVATYDIEDIEGEEEFYNQHILY